MRLINSSTSLLPTQPPAPDNDALHSEPIDLVDGDPTDTGPSPVEEPADVVDGDPAETGPSPVPLADSDPLSSSVVVDGDPADAGPSPHILDDSADLAGIHAELDDGAAPLRPRRRILRLLLDFLVARAARFAPS